MKTLTLPLAIGAVGLALAGATLAIAAPSPRTYASARYHFSVAVPAGWSVRRATRNLQAGRFPESDHPETESLRGPASSRNPEIEMASIRVEPGTTLSAWTATTVGLIAKQFACLSPDRSAHRLAGEPATMLIYQSCVGTYFVDIAVVHNGRGYDVYWLSTDIGNRAMHTADRAFFNRTLKSFRFGA